MNYDAPFGGFWLVDVGGPVEFGEWFETDTDHFQVPLLAVSTEDRFMSAVEMSPTAVHRVVSNPSGKQFKVWVLESASETWIKSQLALLMGF